MRPVPTETIMPSLVSRFHLLLFGVTLAIAGVAIAHLPGDFVFPAHWSGSHADWLWPRNLALAVAPAVGLILMAVFFVLGRALTRNHMAKVRHILDPALTLLLAVGAADQLGLLMIGIGSDFDLFRIATGGLAAALLVLSVVIFEAERHSYAGLRMPWPISSDRAWAFVHRGAGIASGLAAMALAVLVWVDPGPGLLVLGQATSLVALPLWAALLTLFAKSWR